MDSKSISRKGVGVQVPASAPTAPDELARALVPVLLHKLNNTTQYLSALQALLGEVDGESAHHDVFGGLHETALEVDDLGWILGVVANAAGADMLLERRERSRFGALVRLVADCLRRTGRDLARADRDLPVLDVRSAHAAWRVPWSAARWLYGAGLSLPPGAELEWDFVAHASGRIALVCRAPLTSRMEDLGRELCALGCGFEAGVLAHECALTWPLDAHTIHATSRASTGNQP